MASDLLDGLKHQYWDAHRLVVTDALERHYAYDLVDLRRRCTDARRQFPALREATIVLTRDDPTLDRKGAAWRWGNIIFVPEDKRVDNVTLYHELGHLAIQTRVDRGEDLPQTSEEFCGIWSMARMPPEAVDDRRVPHLTTPVLEKEVLPEVCRQALRYREDHHDYIQQCNRWLNGRWHSRDEEYRGGDDGDAA